MVIQALGGREEKTFVPACRGGKSLTLEEEDCFSQRTDPPDGDKPRAPFAPEIEVVSYVAPWSEPSPSAASLLLLTTPPGASIRCILPVSTCSRAELLDMKSSIWRRRKDISWGER